MSLINGVTSGANHLASSVPVADAVQSMLLSAQTAGFTDLRVLAGDLASAAKNDRRRAAELLGGIKDVLPDSDHRPLMKETAEALDADISAARPARDGTQNPSGAAQGRNIGSLMLDLTQIGLSIAGIFDPTPVCDGLDGLISLLRGDRVGAAISAVSLIPYLGDAAKIGKLHKFVNVVDRAADLARTDSTVARRVAPRVEQIGAALRAVQEASLPQSLRSALGALRTRVDEFPMPGPLVRREQVFDVERLRETLERCGDTAGLIEDLIDPVRASLQRAADRGSRELDTEARRNIRVLVDQLRPSTFADIADEMGQRSVLYELFAGAERNVMGRALVRRFDAASLEIGQQHARLTELEDALAAAKGRRAEQINEEIGELNAEIELSRQVLRGQFDPRGAYEMIRDEMYRAARERGIDWPYDAVIHHLVPINEAPELATHPANLLLSRSGAGESHDLIHQLLQGLDTNRWAGWSPAVLAEMRAALDL